MSMQANHVAEVPRWITALLIVSFVLLLGVMNIGNYPAGEPLWSIIANTLILAIPLGLLFFSAWLLLLARAQKRSQGFVGGRPADFIYWTPRIAGILITLFVLLFSFDVFEGSASIWEKLGGFVMHSLPAIGLAVVVVLAWKRPALGFWLFLLAALAFMGITVAAIVRDSQRDMQVMLLGNFLIFTLPLSMIAALYWLNWKWDIRR
jgi:hypothetical protein